MKNDNYQNNDNQKNTKQAGGYLSNQWINFVLILGAGTVFLLSFWLLLDVWLIYLKKYHCRCVVFLKSHADADTAKLY